MKYRFFFIFVGVVFLFTGILYFKNCGNAVAVPQAYDFKTHPCWFEADYQRDIVCGYLTATVEKGAFKLPVVIIKTDSIEPKSDPLIYLNGGPGVSHGLTATGIQRWLSWARLAGLSRDLILMDGRGVGRSLPSLDCKSLQEFNRSLLETDTPIILEREKNKSIVSSCLNDLATRHPQINPMQFGTKQSAKDVVGLMQSLNQKYPEYRAYHLLGVSYGTRLALEVDQILPENASYTLKSMVLDSLYPAGKGGVSSIPQVAGKAFEQLFVNCALSAQCLKSFERLLPQRIVTALDIELIFQQALARLAVAPVAIPVRDAAAGPINLKVTDSRFLAAMFSSAYQVEAWPLAMDGLVDVILGKEDRLKLMMLGFLSNNSNENFNELAFLLNDCQDNGIGDEQVFLAGLAQYSWLNRFFAQDWKLQVCHDQQPFNLVQQGLPPKAKTVVLSGVVDPITPVEWARELKDQWARVEFYESANVAHSVLSENICLLQGLESYFETGLLPKECGDV